MLFKMLTSTNSDTAINNLSSLKHYKSLNTNSKHVYRLSLILKHNSLPIQVSTEEELSGDLHRARLVERYSRRKKDYNIFNEFSLLSSFVQSKVQKDYPVLMK